MNYGDPMARTLAALEAPQLDPRFAGRVAARAKAEMRAPARALDVTRLRLTIARALVPALLTLAAIVQTADAASTVLEIFTP